MRKYVSMQQGSVRMETYLYTHSYPAYFRHEEICVDAAGISKDGDQVLVDGGRSDGFGN